MEEEKQKEVVVVVVTGGGLGGGGVDGRRKRGWGWCVPACVLSCGCGCVDVRSNSPVHGGRLTLKNLALPTRNGSGANISKVHRVRPLQKHTELDEQLGEECHISSRSRTSGEVLKGVRG